MAEGSDPGITMPEGSEIDIRMPEKVYTVGDTIRLRVEFTSSVNVEEVQAVFERYDAMVPLSQPPLGTWQKPSGREIPVGGPGPRRAPRQGERPKW